MLDLLAPPVKPRSPPARPGATWALGTPNAMAAVQCDRLMVPFVETITRTARGGATIGARNVVQGRAGPSQAQGRGMRKNAPVDLIGMCREIKPV